MRELIDDIASTITGQIEAEIEDVIGPLTEEEIKRRCRIVRQQGLPFETLELDGKPMLEIYPVAFEQVREDDRYIIRATQQFRRLP